MGSGGTTGHTSAMRADSPQFRRLVGGAAVACFVAAAVMAVAWRGSELWWGGALRAGLGLAVFWLALPAPGRPAAWEGISPLTGVVVVGAVVLALLRPKIGLPLCGLLLVFRYVFRPPRRRSGPKPPRRARPTGSPQ